MIFDNPSDVRTTKDNMIVFPTTTVPKFFPIDETKLQTLKDDISDGSIGIIHDWNSSKVGKERHRCFAFCDKDGKRRGVPINVIATATWRNSPNECGGDTPTAVTVARQGRYLLGNIIVVIGDELVADLTATLQQHKGRTKSWFSSWR